MGNPNSEKVIQRSCSPVLPCLMVCGAANQKRARHMELQKLVCGGCGAGLDVPASVEYVNCRHCGSALHVRRTESVVFTEVLESLKQQSDRIAENTEMLRIQNEIALLDREWEQEAAGLMIRDKHGRSHTPDSGPMALIVGGGVVAFGLFWTVLAGMMFPPMALFGLVFIAIAVSSLISHQSKAKRYQELQHEHDLKRDELMSRLRSME